MNNLLVAIALLWIANPAISRLLDPNPFASYAKSFHSVVDQIKGFNGMALTYPGIDAECNRLKFYQQMNKKLVPLISCPEDHESEILEYYQEVRLWQIPRSTVFNKNRLRSPTSAVSRSCRCEYQSLQICITTNQTSRFLPGTLGRTATTGVSKLLPSSRYFCFQMSCTELS